MRREVGKETPNKEMDLVVFLWRHTWHFVSKLLLICRLSIIIVDTWLLCSCRSPNLLLLPPKIKNSIKPSWGLSKASLKRRSKSVQYSCWRDVKPHTRNSQRERGGNVLLITLVPKVLQFFCIRWLNNFGDCYWILIGWFNKLSVQKF